MDDDRLDKLFRALSDPVRRRMVDLMHERPRMTGELVKAFPDLTRYAVMRHLNQLDEAGLVTVRREGRKRWNQLNAVPLREMYERWVSRYEGAWSSSVLDLRRLAEGEDGG